MEPCYSNVMPAGDFVLLLPLGSYPDLGARLVVLDIVMTDAIFS